MVRPKLQTFGDVFAARKVIAQAIDYVDGTHEIAHIHHRAQLVYATSGIVRAITPLGLWMLTPGNALLIGSQVEHELHMVGQVSMRTLYIEPASLAPQKQECRVIPVGDLLRATILGMFDSDPDEAGESRTALIVPLILRLLEDAADAADGARTARLPLPANVRLRNICESLIAQPASNDTLELWAAMARTVAPGRGDVQTFGRPRGEPGCARPGLCRRAHLHRDVQARIRQHAPAVPPTVPRTARYLM